MVISSHQATESSAELSFPHSVMYCVIATTLFQAFASYHLLLKWNHSQEVQLVILYHKNHLSVKCNHSCWCIIIDWGQYCTWTCHLIYHNCFILPASYTLCDCLYLLFECSSIWFFFWLFFKILYWLYCQSCCPVLVSDTCLIIHALICVFGLHSYKTELLKSYVVG